jgi:hypothetical protein
MNAGWKINRPSLSKYDGLLKIEMMGLSHPQWVFVSSSSEVPAKPWADAPIGWTARCCSTHSYEFGLPSKHMLPFTELKSIVVEFAERLEIDVRFVIYPSWEFDVSGCCLMTNDRITVEAVKGDIAPLLRGQANPDVVLESPSPFFQKFNLVSGRSDLLGVQDQGILIASCRKLEVASTLVLEWSKTLPGAILFHDWLEFV